MKTKFKIGDWVLCGGTIERKHKYDDHKNIRVVWEKNTFDHPKIVQVCGASYRSNGYIVSSGYGEDFEKYFSPTNSFFAYEVKLGLTNKPLVVLEEELLKIDVLPLNMELPFRYVRYTPEDRRVLSEFSKELPRDKRGRFV
jgi:hypothetical protein